MSATITIQEGWAPGQEVRVGLDRSTGATAPFRVPAHARPGDVVPLQGEPPLPEIRAVVARLWSGVKDLQALCAGVAGGVVAEIANVMLHAVLEASAYDYIDEEDADGGASDAGIFWCLRKPKLCCTQILSLGSKRNYPEMPLSRHAHDSSDRH